jgi:hypothetical protein
MLNILNQPQVYRTAAAVIHLRDFFEKKIRDFFSIHTRVTPASLDSATFLIDILQGLLLLLPQILLPSPLPR